MSLHTFPNGRHNPDENSPADIIKLAQHVLNGGEVEYWSIRDQGWKLTRYTAKYSPFDFSNSVYRIVPNLRDKAPVVYKYFRKHVPSGAESRTSFSEYEYTRLGIPYGDGIPLKEAQALIERWNANLPDAWAYTLD